jgi:hypothetical protein
VPAGEREFTNHNFSETFDPLPFTAISPVKEIGRNGKPAKNRRGEVQWTNEIHERAKQAKSGRKNKDLPSFRSPLIGLMLYFPK